MYENSLLKWCSGQTAFRQSLSDQFLYVVGVEHFKIKKKKFRMDIIAVFTVYLNGQSATVQLVMSENTGNFIQN